MLRWWRAQSQVQFGSPDGGRAWRQILGIAALGLVLQFMLLVVMAREMRDVHVMQAPSPYHHHVGAQHLSGGPWAPAELHH